MINYMRNETNNVAYVWEDEMASMHVARSEFIARDGEAGAMRVAKEPLCKLTQRNKFFSNVSKNTVLRLRTVITSSGKCFTL